MKDIVNKAKTLLGLVKIEAIATRDELITTASQVAVTQLKRDTLTLQMDAEIQQIRDKYSRDIETLNTQVEHDVKRIKNWAVANRKEVFGDKQSVVIAGHELSFHQSPGAVAFTDGKKAADVIDIICALPGEEGDAVRESLLRVKPELNKDAVQREFRMGHGKEMAALGLTITKEESFTFTPSREETASIAETTAMGKEAA